MQTLAARFFRLPFRTAGLLCRRAAAWAPSRALLVDLLLIGGVCGLVWSGIWALLEQQRSYLLGDAAHEIEMLAQASEENTLRTIDALDRTLLFLRAAYLEDPGRLDLPRWGRELKQQVPDELTLQVSIMDAQGKQRASSLGPVTAQVDISDREHFLAQRSSTEDRLFISKPVLGRSTGRWSIQFVRKIVDGDGGFAGVVVISADPFRLAQLYASLQLGRGGVILAGTDGVIRAGSMGGAAELGRDIAGSPLLAAAREAANGSLETRGPGGRVQLVNFRRLDRYGLVLAVAADREEVLESFYRARRGYVSGGALLTALILIVGGIVVRSRQTLRRSQQALTDTLEHMSQGIFMIDADRSIAVINHRAIELLGLPPDVAEAGMRYDDILRWQLQSGEFAQDESMRRLAEAGGLEGEDCVFERVRPNGTVLEVRSRFLAEEGRTIRTITDLTERKQAEAHIRYLAHHDGLTGLANRRSFQDRLAQAISLGHRSGTPFAVLCVDLDGFKYVNDSRGHDVGDLLLQAVGERLRASVREEDTVTRFGGDEFSILQTDVGQPAAAAALAERLVACLGEPYELRGAPVVVGASVGVALFPTDGHTAEQLLKSADIALYGAKEAGRRTFRFFEPEMDRRLQERFALERDFAEALAAGAIEVHFQPICDIGSRQAVGFEALARWTHPVRGSVPPKVFIPLAEEIGLIAPLGRCVLRGACQQAVTWPPHLRVAVNLSPAQLVEPDLVGQIRSCLEETGLDPRRLDLEVTEGLLIRNGDAALAAMRTLRGSGVRVYLDDFGTGHAGLTYLLRFPFDGIKVDRSFVANLATDPASQAIVRAAMLLSENLGLAVVAEGVETEAQLECLRALRCHQAQGFLLGRPQPAADLRPPEMGGLERRARARG